MSSPDAALDPSVLSTLAPVWNALPNALFVKDRSHRWVVVNDAFCTLVGLPRDVLYGKSDHEFFPRDEADTFWKVDDEVFRTGGPIENEEPLTVADGERRWLLTRKVRATLPDGTDVLVGIITDITDRKASEALRASFARRVIEAQEEDRRRVARDIHDAVGQLLTSTRMALGHSEGMSAEDIRARMSNAANLCGQALDEVRRISADLHPAVLADLGLHAALASHVERFSRSCGTEVDLHVDEAGLDELTVATQTTLYRVVQEALNNVARHAKATSVSVVLTHHKDALRLVIEDNGSGFEHDPAEEEGLGLRSMTERAHLLGGSLTVESAKGAGTVVRVDLPRTSVSPEPLSC